MSGGRPPKERRVIRVSEVMVGDFVQVVIRFAKFLILRVLRIRNRVEVIST